MRAARSWSTSASRSSRSGSATPHYRTSHYRCQPHPGYVTILSRTDVYLFANRARLEGQVTDHNLLPIEGVTLALSNGATDLTGPDGLYAFQDLVIGSYAITPTLDGYVFVPPFAVKEDFVSSWQSFILLAPPVSTTLEPGITTTLTYTDVQGLPTSFIFPSWSCLGYLNRNRDPDPGELVFWDGLRRARLRLRSRKQAAQPRA